MRQQKGVSIFDVWYIFCFLLEKGESTMEYVTWEGLFTFVMCMAAVIGVFSHWTKKK